MPRLVASLLLIASPLVAAEPKVQRDVAYVEPKTERQTLDIYAPAQGSDHPIVVWIHGGGWRQGDKQGVQQKPQAFVDRGFVFVSINYRFVPQVTVKEMTGDVAKAIRWVHDHAQEHGGNPNSLFVMGHSAGAHLAALVCTDDRYLKAEGLPLSIIKGCVPVDTAAYDIPLRFAKSDAAKSSGGKALFGDDEASHKELSPITYVDTVKSLPAFLILHVADRPDSKIQSEHFAQALKKAGVAATVVAAEGKTHGTINSDLGLPSDKPTKALFEFVDRQLAARSKLGQRLNMIGPYGPWLSEKVLGDGPALMSFRTGNWKSLDQWRAAARSRVWECMAPVDQGGQPEVRVESTQEFDGLSIERLSWQLPGGPRTEAVFLKPAGVKGRLPAILALHDHGGNKLLGWRKIAKIDDQPWPIIATHHERYYGGVAWANEIAKRGYAVLVHDTFPFASRRVRVADVPERLRQNGVDPEPDDEEGIKRYNAFASAHEHIMEKSLLSAGTTWPGVYVVEDQRALDVLCARPDVDPRRVGCAGLSGGGMRTVFLGGLDDRIRCAVAVGFMTTWREFLMDKCFTHTWMTYVPLLPRDLDFPEILALRAPAATMVLNCTEDGLYTVAEMRRADTILRETFEQGGAAEMYRCNFYPGGHKFDLEMQADAFAWFDRHLQDGN